MRFCNMKVIFMCFVVAAFFSKYLFLNKMELSARLCLCILIDAIIVLSLFIIIKYESIKIGSLEKIARTIMNNIPYPIYYKTSNGDYLFCNNAFSELVNMDKSEIIGKKEEDIMPEKSGLNFQKLDVDLVKSPGIQIYEFTTDIFNGTKKDYILRKDIVYDSNDKIIGIIGVFFDITEMKELSVKLDNVEKIDKIRREFFSNISHDLRTPINVIVSAIQLMEIEKTYSASHINMIKQNSYRLLKLVNNLIDISKIEAGYYKLNLGNYNIVSIVEDLVLSVVDYIKSNNLKIVFDTNVEEKVIACDPEKIERIILNLISNSIKFTPKNGKIEVTITDKENSIVICVKDNGIGIKNDKLDTIFQRFVQINDDCETRKREGSGIGLSLVKSLTEMHGGKVWVESEKGKGAAFYIELPNKQVEGQKNEVLEKNNNMLNVEFSEIKR